MWLFTSLAFAVDLPALAATRGHAAALEAVDVVVASSKPKKLAGALEQAGLSRVAMPVRPFFGAELTITATTPLTDCAWTGRIGCTFTVSAETAIAPGELAATCRSALGSQVPVPIRLVQAGPIATFAVEDVRPCWGLGDELLVHPVPDDALEGIGEGDEFMAPELSGLKKTQVDAEITKRSPEFRRCGVRASGRAAGVVVLEFHLDAQGRVDRATIASSTLEDPAVEACLVEQLQRLRFPPPAGGYEGGTYPFTFQ